VEDLKTAVSEACINAMEHGNKNHPEKRVLVSMNYKDHVFSVSVVDQGEGMNEVPIIPKRPDIDRKIEMLEPHRGLGLFLIEQLVDQVEYNKVTDKGHMVRMVLKLTG
jgi:serine/threonine-protein kinase RsbW